MEKKRKIFIVFCTRPEAIKLAPVIRELRESADLDVRVCTFRQHKGMLDQTMSVFGISSDYNFNVFFGDQGFLGAGKNFLLMGWRGMKAGWGMLRFFLTLKRERPDLIIVQGDTSTAFLAAFLAFHFRINIAHVEAGLRTNNKYAPFPEEINRRLICVLADLHFAPTEDARQNLLKEGVDPERVWVTGNTALDAFRLTIEAGKNKEEEFEARLAAMGIPADDKRLVVATAHRRENFGEGLAHIAEALKELAEKGGVRIVYPMHPNPNVAKAVLPVLEGVESVHLVEPLDYATFAYLMNKAHLILTDSGGIQEEVSFLGKPTLVMREVTERPEGLGAGTTKLVGVKKEDIVAEALSLLNNEDEYRKMAVSHQAFGDGFSAKKIKEAILSFLS